MLPEEKKTTPTPNEQENKLSRREFIKEAALVAGGVAVAGGLAACASAPTPPVPAPVAAQPCPTTAAAAPVVVTATPVAQKWDYEADVVVVGYGGGGAIAAITAIDAGAKVLILEKTAADTPTAVRQQNSTRISNSGQTCWNGTLEEGVAYCKYAMSPYIPEDVITALVTKWKAYVPWIQGMGGKPVVTARPPSAIDNIAPGLAGGKNISAISWLTPDEVLGGSAYNPHVFGGTKYWQMLTANVTKRGIKVLFESPAKRLVYKVDTQEVIGVEAASGGKPVFVKANRAVVISSGGIEQNEQMKLRAYRGLRVEFTSSTGNTGDGLAMLQDLGADIWNMNFLAPRLALNRVHFPGVSAGVPLTLAAAKGGSIIIDQFGKRFANDLAVPELALYVWDANSASYPRNPAWFIFDETRRTTPPALGGSVGFEDTGIYKWSDGSQDEISKGWILKGATLDELVTKINSAKNMLVSPNVVGKMDAAALKDTVDKYNQYCATGVDTEFSRAKATLTPFTTGPFYAVAVFPGAEESYGGPRKNGKGQILRSDGSVIRRVYEAGELGMTSTTSSSPISAMTETALSGMIAGESAAAEKPWVQAT